MGQIQPGRRRRSYHRADEDSRRPVTLPMKQFTEAELIEMERRTLDLPVYAKTRIYKLEQKLNGWRGLSDDEEEKTVMALDAWEAILVVCEDLNALIARYRADHKPR